MANRVQYRRDTKTRWAEVNPILMEGEVGLETDTQNIKMGDGVHAWNDLEYGVGYSNVTNEPGTSENLVISQKGVTELVEGTKDGITATKFPTVKIEDFATGVTETGSAKSAKILENFRTWLDGVDFSSNGKHIGHCRISLDGRNGDVYNYVFSYANKYGAQVVKGGFGLDSDGKIKTVEGYNVLYRIVNNGSLGKWIDNEIVNVLGDDEDKAASQSLVTNIRTSIYNAIIGFDGIIKESDKKDGVWSITNNRIETSYYLSQNFYTYFFDVALFDKLYVSGSIDSTYISSASNFINSVVLYNEDEVIFQVNSLGKDVEIELSNYKQYGNLKAIINANKNQDLIVKGVITGIDNDIKELQESVSNNEKNLSQISNKINGVNKNIFTELFSNLRNGWWNINTEYPNGHLVSFNTVQKVKCTDKIDITSYDSVTLKGLFNGQYVSTINDFYCAVFIYGDGKYIKGEQKITTESYNIFLSDYSQYSKVEIVLNIALNDTLDGPKIDDNIVQVVSSGINKNTDVKRLVICGDSLTGNRSALLVKEFDSILSAQGYDPIIYRSMGGENIIGNLTRAGGLGIRVKAPFTIPKTGSVNCLLESQWILSKTDKYAQNPYNSISGGGNSVTICGITGKLLKSNVNIAGIAFYTSEKTLISTLSENGTYKIPDNSAYYRFTINNPQTGVAHITINNSAVDIDTETLLDGYIDTNGVFSESSNYKCSDYINIEKGTIYIDSLATSTAYTFTRDEDGEAVKVGIGEVFFDYALYDDKDYPHIWFTGQNMGYSNEKEWADMIKSATMCIGEKYIVCSTALSGTTDELIKEANIHFGCKYLNLRAYTQGQAVYDGQRYGIIDEQYNADDYEKLFWPGSDKVHQNNLLSYIWAVKMWNKLLELGYVEGVRIDTGEYYVK